MEEAQQLIEEMLTQGMEHDEIVMAIAQQMGIALPEEGLDENTINELDEETIEALTQIDELVSAVEDQSGTVEE